MAINKERKQELVAQYGDLLNSATGLVVTEYRGLNVAQVNDMRDKLRDIGGTYIITKNTLLSIALKEAGWPVPENLLLGPVAVALGGDNFPSVAKMVMGFLKDYEQFLVIKGGVMGGQVFDAKQIEIVSNLPSLDELRAQLAGLISQPAAGLVGVINGAVAAVPQVLQAYVQKNSPEGEAA